MKPKIGAWFDPQYMALWFYEGCDNPEDGASYPAYCIALTENAPIHDGGIPEHCFDKLIYIGPSIERSARSASRNPRPDPRFGPQTSDQDAAERAAANANAEKAIDLLERFNRSCGADRISVEHEIGAFVAKRTFAKLRKHFGGDA